MKFPSALDAEIKRIANTSQRSLEEVVQELAEITSRSTRQIYNWRSGKWSPHVSLLPALCKFFRSQAILDALLEDCGETDVQIPDGYDLTRLVSETVREDLGYYKEFLDDFESDGIQPQELTRLRELAERVVRNVYHFVEIAATDCERRSGAKAHQAQEVDRA